jgi:predicted enzyme related to lactoylglutathione lyase
VALEAGEYGAMGLPVVHFEIHGDDPERIAAFYSTVFEWKVNADNPMHYSLVDTDADGEGIGGGICSSAMAPAVLIYVQVDDPQAYLDKAEAAGGQTILPVTEIPGAVTMAILEDPAGNRIGLVKR